MVVSSRREVDTVPDRRTHHTGPHDLVDVVEVRQGWLRFLSQRWQPMMLTVVVRNASCQSV